MPRYLQLVHVRVAFVNLVGRRHPQRQAAVVDERRGGKVEQIAQQGAEAVRLLGRDEVRLAKKK